MSVPQSTPIVYSKTFEGLETTLNDMKKTAPTIDYLEAIKMFHNVPISNIAKIELPKFLEQKVKMVPEGKFNRKIINIDVLLYVIKCFGYNVATYNSFFVSPLWKDKISKTINIPDEAIKNYINDMKNSGAYADAIRWDLMFDQLLYGVKQDHINMNLVT